MGALSFVTLDPELLALKDIILRQKAVDVQVDNAEMLKMCNKIALEMFEVMYKSDGAGIAAPQVGIPLRLVTMDPARLKFGPHVLINPIILSSSETQVGDFEGCLSLPLCTGKIYRSTEVHVQAYNLQGNLEDYHADGWLARIFQHEIDHLDGLLYPDRFRPEDNLLPTESGARRRAIDSLAKSIEEP